MKKYLLIAIGRIWTLQRHFYDSITIGLSVSVAYSAFLASVLVLIYEPLFHLLDFSVTCSLPASRPTEQAVTWFQSRPGRLV